MKKRRRAIALWAAFTLLGVVMSYAVAWVCMLGDSTLAVLGPSPKTGEATALGRPAVLLVWSSRSPGASCCLATQSDLPWKDSQGLTPYWIGDLWWPLERGAELLPDTMWIGSGIPFRCCRGSMVFESNPVVSRGFIQLTGGPHGMWICFEPYWPGLLIDAAFYGSVLWLFSFGLGVIRRVRRRRRGLCAGCGYPVGVSAMCSECGAAVESGVKQ